MSRPGAPRRTPAALVLGVLAGVLAAVAVLPTTVPLTNRVSTAEDRSATARVLAASRALALLYENDLVLQAGLAHSLQVDGVRVLGAKGEAWFADGELPRSVPLATLCPPGEAPGRIVEADEDRWAVACRDIAIGHAIAVSRASAENARNISWLVLGLSAMVGLSTAFGVLQILSPLSRIEDGLERVGSGERGVRIQSTGLAELDQLVERLNAAARAMEDREDAVLGRIEVVQEMARVVAHEIRNPLQSLELLAGLMASEEDPTERAELASSIQEEVRQLERVVNRMLRGNDGPALRLLRAPTSVLELVGKVIAFRLPEARRHGITLVQGPVVDVTIEADRTLLSRALENLVANGLAHAPRNTGRVLVSAAVEDGKLVLQVDDDGPGVPPEVGDAIYQPAYSTRPGGIGLGLALVQGVLAAHGGYVEHGRSTLGGASFRAVLPLVTPVATLVDPVRPADTLRASAAGPSRPTSPTTQEEGHAHPGRG